MTQQLTIEWIKEHRGLLRKGCIGWQVADAAIQALEREAKLRTALLDAKHIISSDLGTEIESIENALEKYEKFKDN